MLRERCIVCGKEFAPESAGQTACSRACVRTFVLRNGRLARRALRKVRRPVSPDACPQCGGRTVRHESAFVRPGTRLCLACLLSFYPKEA